MLVSMRSSGASRASSWLRRGFQRRLLSEERFKGPKELNEAQKKVLEDINRTRTTGLKGPFGPWLANPELAQAAQTLGRIARYETSLTPRESELVILTTAQFHKSQTEWDIHVKEARRVGLQDSFIDQIEKGILISEPPRESVLHEFSKEVLTTSAVSDVTYKKMLGEFSETQIVETVSIIGYYGLVALTLNVFHIRP